VYRPVVPIVFVLAAMLATLGISPEGVAAVKYGPPAPAVCARPVAGGKVTEPPALFSRRGALNVDLDYVSSVDQAGRTLFCFITPDGLESPTLHVRPGDILHVRLKNLVQLTAGEKAGTMAMSVGGATPCGAAFMDATSVNMHFHGADVPASCHVDDVVHTLVNAGQSFDYRVRFPKIQPPGLYWYHPHVHGQSEQAVKGGASGAIVVDGIENLQPKVGGLPERTLIVRDQSVSGDLAPGGAIPTSDVTLNYVPIAYPGLAPAVIPIKAGRREFWRVLNASAETVLDIAVTYDGVDQPLDVVGLDGVPTGSHNGITAGQILTMSHIVIPAAGRAEFIVDGPRENVRAAALVTRSIAMGPDGDNDTARTLAHLVADRSGLAAVSRSMPEMSAPAPAPRGPRDTLDRATISARRSLFLSEVLADPYDPSSQPKYFITVTGTTPRVYDPASPPAIVTTQGAVEEWTIENHSREMHEFHIHQIHFKLIKRDGAPVPTDQRQYLDTTQIPFWTGKGPYPSVTVLLDFRGDVTGDLLYHCHMLDHEDGGMMAVVRVLPKSAGTRTRSAQTSALPARVGERAAKAG
jgi:FtsP/CotA-like multicopper oxidase with cupredoxin domain